MNEAELITLMEQHIKDSSCHVIDNVALQAGLTPSLSL